MNAGFLNAWKIYRHGTKRPAFAGEAPRGEAAFDAEVKVGEIRVFADGNQPLTALIVADCGLSGRRIVPVSPFAAPASDRELLVGARVFQLWNATRASRRFTDRSWRVDTLSAEDLAAVQAAIPAAQPGRLTVGDCPQARYEREFLISAGNFIPFAEPKTATAVHRWRVGWRVAASLALCLGAFGLMFGGGGKRLATVWQDVAFRATEDPAYETIELVEPEASEAEYADLSRDQIQRETAPANAIPQLPTPWRLASVVKSDLPTVRDGRLGRTPGAAGLAAGFVRAEQPAVLMTGRATSEKGGATLSYASAVQPTVAAAGAVRCTVVECPWNTSHRLLNVRAADAQGLRIEIGFDPKAVGGYRLVANADDGTVNAFYEIVPNGLSGVPNAAVSVTTRWYDAQGERQRAEAVRTGVAADLPGLPQLPRKGSASTGAVSPDDVSVKVDL